MIAHTCDNCGAKHTTASATDNRLPVGWAVVWPVGGIPSKRCENCTAIGDPPPVTLRYAPLKCDVGRTISVMMKLPGEPESQPCPTCGSRVEREKIKPADCRRSHAGEPVADPLNAIHEEYCDYVCTVTTGKPYSFAEWLRWHHPELAAARLHKES